MLLIKCPNCEAQYNVNPGKTDKPTTSIKCPACQHLFSISLANGSLTGDEQPTVDNRPKVLIVDDSQSFRLLVADLLKPLNLNILHATNGHEALQVIAREHPRLVILDLVLPDTRGEDIVRKIKSFQSLATTRFLVLSGTIMNDNPPAEIKMCGADDFSSKSFKPEQFQRRVAALLEQTEDA